MRRTDARSAGSEHRKPSSSWALSSSAGGRARVSSSFKRKSRRDRMQAKLSEIKEELRRRMHQAIPEQGRWLAQVIRGYFAYHAVPTNLPALSAFRHYVKRLWRT